MHADLPRTDGNKETAMAQHHEIPATPDKMVLGYLDAASPPVIFFYYWETL